MNGPGLPLNPPPGTYDALPPQAQERRRLEARLRTLFELWGYEEVITPTFELDEVVAQAGGQPSGRQTYRFVDRDGQVMVLRPDWTAAVARLVAGRMRGAPLPIRLFYVGSVFRYDRRRPDDSREFGQAGVELMGAQGPVADAEVMALAWESCRQAGIPDPHVEVGHAGYVQALLGQLPVESAQAARRALVRRDLVAYEAALAGAGVPPPAARALEALVDARGGVEVVEAAYRACPAGEGQAALRSVLELFEHLRALGLEDHVAFDLGMVKDLDYYTGAIFEVYAPDGDASLATGGRYDTLLGRLGMPLASTGCAVSLDRVLNTLHALPGRRSRQRSGPQVWIVRGTGPQGPEQGPPSGAWKLAAALRQSGISCALDPLARPLPESLQEARRAGVEWVAAPLPEGALSEKGEPALAAASLADATAAGAGQVAWTAMDLDTFVQKVTRGGPA
ncbi:MAG: ATP phosphoribosyltransferase regulatory subunit [Limnochordaceae bacterium]|nr:ATP phosphoribosyltransferase regulatory subunit [Limnochordaceae bacterium]